jgi:hypothetical protein|tara:strand:- start:16367 stop:16834 length:468 start_codon:yes stop_codon:yes gene_type:complete
MAYQKLNTSRAWSVTPSDDAPIPNFMLKSSSGSVSGAAGFNINVAGANFVVDGVVSGMVIVNTTTNASAIITGVEEDELILNVTGAFVGGDNFQIYGGQNNGAVLYVGTAGNVRVLTAGNDDVTFSGVQDGSFIPVNCIKVFATNTSANNILALW